MTKIALMVTAATFVLMVPVASMAGYYHGACGMMKQSWDMDDMDADGNGMLTLEEYAEPHMERLRGSFDRIDTDKDGVISDAEWRALMEAHSFSAE